MASTAGGKVAVQARVGVLGEAGVADVSLGRNRDAAEEVQSGLKVAGAFSVAPAFVELVPSEAVLAELWRSAVGAAELATFAESERGDGEVGGRGTGILEAAVIVPVEVLSTGDALVAGGPVAFLATGVTPVAVPQLVLVHAWTAPPDTLVVVQVEVGVTAKALV